MNTITTRHIFSMTTFRLFPSTTFTFVTSWVLLACSISYPKAKPVASVSEYPIAIEQAKTDHRYFVMQSGLNFYTVTSVDLDKAKQEMTVTLNKVDSSRLLNVGNYEGKRYKRQKGEPRRSSQIHLYMNDSTSYTLDEPHTIPLGKVGRVELFD